MSLIRRIRVLLATTLLLALVGGVLIGIVTTRDLLRADATRQNRQDAFSLAQALSATAEDTEAGARIVLALFDTGAYRRIQLIGADGRVRFAREATPASRAPEWFARWAALDAEPGIAPHRPVGATRGSVEILCAAGPLVDALWRMGLRLAGALAALSAVVGAAGFVATGRLRRALDRTIRHAESLHRGDFVNAAESGLPELRRLTRALNATAARVKEAVDARGAQVEAIRSELTRDPQTELPNRRHFLEQLEAATQRDGGAAPGGLVLLRLLDLGGINRALGRRAADRVIGVIAQALQTYALRVEGCFIGRLNGSDFALSLPAPDVAEETARAVMDLLRAALPAFGANVTVVAGAIESSGRVGVSQWMRAADLALLSAQRRGDFAVESGRVTPQDEATDRV